VRSPGEDWTGGALTVRLLGPFEASVGGRLVTLTTGRPRTVLAVLAMSADQPVSVDRLAAALWSDDQPCNTRRAVQTYVARLRTVLGAATIDRTANGYVLRTDPDRVDTLRFLRLLEAAEQATDTTTERARLDEALALWRGTPFDGLHSDWLAHTHAPRLVEPYLVAVERRIDLDLAGGLHLSLIGRLRELTSRYPLREPLWVRLLAALDGCGRPAEALEQYERIRVRLAEELGTEPGPALRQIYSDLLAGAPVTVTTAPGTAARAATPRQLPAPVHGFAGRVAALQALDGLLSDREPDAASADVCVITGTAGVGKTTLAVQWAHRVAGRFPDGQLYVNLRGYHPYDHAMTPADAVCGFLDALGVPPNRRPSSLDAQTALYRSLLADKHILVLLDNARDAEQVRHLLPGSPGCAAVITSRDQLTGLVAAVAASQVTLNLLSADEARELLAARLGADRVNAEPESTDEIAARCARLPLALATAAAYAAGREHAPLSTLAADLRGSRSGLDTFSTGDPATDVRAVFSWSYRTLSPRAARLFRALGMHPGPGISTSAAASLAALPLARVRPVLAELCRAHLLTANPDGRYACHDLLRAYAGELAASEDSGADRHAALRRLLDHLVHTGHAAAALLNPHRKRLAVGPPLEGVTVDDLDRHDQAVAWFIAEREVLPAAVNAATVEGFDIHACRLAWTIAEFCERPEGLARLENHSADRPRAGMMPR
jgi:DNA-binding SARP family transcriptional activator